MEPLFWPRAGQRPVRNLRRQLTHGQLFWREIGQGTAVVFLHGSWTDGDQWRDVLVKLGQSHHCLAPDLIGFGESQRLQDKSAYAIAMEVETLAELFESLRLKAVVLVGHSLGAWVAARYALQYPQQVKALCVLEPEGIVYDPQRWRQERWLASRFGGLWLAITKPFARKSLPGKPSFWLQNYHLRQLLKKSPTACRLLFQRRRKELESETVGNQLASLDMPIVVLQGEGAGKTSQRLVQTFVGASANAVVKIVPGNDELPSYGADAIADFLKQWLPTV